MASLAEMLTNKNFVVYLNSLDKWVVHQEYEALDKLYAAWNADVSIQRFLSENILDANYPQLFVGKYFLYEQETNEDRKLPSELPEVGKTYTRTNNKTHNWSKKKDVAVDFSKIHYAAQPKTAYSNGFIAQCESNVPSKSVVCDCMKTINYISIQAKNPQIIKLAMDNKVYLIQDILSGNDMMEEEHEVIVDGGFDKAKIIATWRRVDDGGKIFVDKKGLW
jgi:hypothetical protein